MEFSAINFSNLQICEEKYVPHFSKFFQIIEMNQKEPKMNNIYIQSLTILFKVVVEREFLYSKSSKLNHLDKLRFNSIIDKYINLKISALHFPL